MVTLLALTVMMVSVEGSNTQFQCRLEMKNMLCTSLSVDPNECFGLYNFHALGAHSKIRYFNFLTK